MEDDYIVYNEWANDELIWGSGQNNWCRAYSLEEWSKEPVFEDYDELLKVEIPF